MEKLIDSVKIRMSSAYRLYKISWEILANSFDSVHDKNTSAGVRPIRQTAVTPSTCCMQSHQK